MKARQLAKLIRAQKEYTGQNVRLLSCSTGKKENEHEVCFAEELANALNVTVMAPDDVIIFTADGSFYVGREADGDMVMYSPNKMRRIK